MCGICGYVDLQARPPDAQAGRRMMRMLAHRGPDGEGHVTLPQAGEGSGAPTVFLGHRRLKIIDLSEAASQPMTSEDGQVWVVFNGEIYNFRELRADLEAKAHWFRSQSDTETIVHAYEQYGDDTAARLDGMFAFALWDGRRRRLLLARDRTGKKPLYYTFDGTRLTFASEIKALLACPWVSRRPAVERIPAYLVCGYVAGPHTLYQDILQVPPASCVVLDGRTLHGPWRYWSLRFPDPGEESRLPQPDAAERVRHLLTQAVARRLVSDVPLGALLSGGLDSSAIVALMTRLCREPVRTFSIGFEDDLSYDERPFAAQVADRYRTRHTEFVVRADAAALMEQLLWHHDQPYGDSSALPTYLVCRLARRYVTVALTGDGGDEVFAGYDRFRAALLADRLPAIAGPIGMAVSRLLPSRDGYYSLRRRLARFVEDGGRPIGERFLGWTAYFRPSMVPAILHDDLRLHAHDGWGPALERFHEVRGLPLLQRLLYVNFLTYLPDDLHVKMDRMSMAVGLETRAPMLDTALVEFAAALPAGLKVQGSQTKAVLRQAVADLLPLPIVRRRKHGFGVPLDRWFRTGLKIAFEDLVLSSGAPAGEFLSQDAVRGLFTEHLSGMRDHGQRLWVLMNLGLWLHMLRRDVEWMPAATEAAEVVASR